MWLHSQSGASTDGGSHGRTRFHRPMVVCKEHLKYIQYIVNSIILYEFLKSALTRQYRNTLTKNYLNPHLYQVCLSEFFWICNSCTRLCDHGVKVILLENMMYDAMPSYCWIATVLHSGFPFFCSKYKWPYWLNWIKEVEISIKSKYKEHLGDEVETEELAAQYSCKTL